MIKNSYIPKLWKGLSLPQFSFGCFPWGKNKSKQRQPENITIHLNRQDQENYIHSFLKKRILTTWKKQRNDLRISSVYSDTLEKQLYQHTYNQLRPLLLASYGEDFNQPYTEFAFQSWLQYVKILAQISGKYRDARYWEELTKFIHHCSQHNLVDL